MEHPDSSFIPDATTMMRWIETICDFGIRRPGYPADVKAEQWAEERFLEAGLQNVRREPVELPRWEPKSWSLEVWSDNEAAVRIELDCFPLPHSAPTPGIEAPIARDGDISGCLAVSTTMLTQLPQSLVRERALAFHDPDDEFSTLVQTLPFGRDMQAVMEPAMAAGAAGFIGIFDAPWETCDYYVPYDGIARPIPGVWISKASGQRLDDLMGAGPVTGRLVVDSVREPVTTNNIVGELPGSSDEWIVIGSHHDGPWVSAVEDASGMALLVAQAKYWAQVPEAERPHNMIFTLNSGHMVHGAGMRRLMLTHPDLIDNIVLAVHLEHTARECKGVDGKLVPTDDPEVAWWFTTRNDSLIETVRSALESEDLRRSFVVPPDLWAPFPTTDGGFFHMANVPLVDFLAAPMYLFDSQDTPDKIHEPSLVPVTRAAIRIIASALGTSAAAMRAGDQDPARVLSPALLHADG
ncbi:MAG: M28 family peptidase [Actinomycetota bacterium]